MPATDTAIIPAPRPRKRRPRWRRWYVLIPAIIVAVLIGITALGAAVGPYPAAVKATTIKPSAAAPVCLSLADAAHQETS